MLPMAVAMGQNKSATKCLKRAILPCVLRYKMVTIWHTMRGAPRFKLLFLLILWGNLAERQGFEPWVRSRAQRFSRPPRSTTPAPLRRN